MMARHMASPYRKNRPRVPRQFWYGLAAVGLVLASIGLVAFSYYLVALDKDIRTRFAGVRWALPAQVFASPLELYSGLNLDAGDLKHELERLGYRNNDTLDGPGEFVLAKDHADIYIRAFHFWDGPRPESKISVKFDAAGITDVSDAVSRESRDIVRMDPMLIGSIYPQQDGEDRVLVKLDEVPDLLREGLLAVEDKDFYDHFGISIRGVLRAMFVNLRAGHTVQGASTVTQQLVRNFFLTLDRTWSRKFNEMFMSILLERHYSKNDILEAYFNEIYLGQDGNRAIHGFGLASWFYFNKPIGELRDHEVALLVGVVKGASFYNPRRNPVRAKARRDLVLHVFKERGLIDEAEMNAAIERPLSLAGSKQGGVERYPAFVDMVKRQLRGQYKDSDLTDEGLRIFTTLDPRAQEALERNIEQGLGEIEKSKKIPNDTLEAAGVVTSVGGGEILGVVGGRDVRYSGFNRALDSRRSIGSLVKPFVYLTALEQGDRYNLHTILDDEPIELKLPTKQIWAPNNYDHKLHGPQPLYNALAQSYNLPTVRLGLEIGEKAVAATLKQAGYTANPPLLPSMFLGAVDVAPVEVAQMFGTLAAGGFQSPLSSIREVTTKEGEPLNRYPIRVKQTLPEGPVYLTTWAMTQVMRLGTGRSAYSVLPGDMTLAGKSGTTDDLRDSWFSGFSGDRVAVVWVGRDDYKPMGLSGSTGALYIWSRLIKDLKVKPLDLIPPPDVEEQEADTITGLRADDGCQSRLLIPYLRGFAPQTWAPCAHAAESQPMQWLREIFQ
jgi:penicillin-binding protein 1B